jgi:glycosyltransferase involved in cell wall biosynthesis
MKRILIVADDPTLNTGYARVGRFLATTLQQNGYKVKYLPCNVCTPEVDRKQYNFELMDFDYGDRYANHRINRVLSTYKPALVIVLGEFAYVGYIGHTCRNMGIKSMYYFPIEGDNYPPTIVYQQGGFIDFPLTLQKFHYIVAYSEFGARNINHRLPGIVTEIIPHQVNTKIFRPLDRKRVFETFFPNLCESPGMDKTFVVGYVGRNQRRKGMDYVLQGFAEFYHKHVDPKFKDAYLFLVTDPKDPLGFNLYDMIDDLKMNNNHICINAVVGGKNGPLDNQLCEIYNTLDLCLCPHRAEGFGLTLLESMACGTQVLTTRYATPAEFGDAVAYIEPSWFELVVGTNCKWATLDPKVIAEAINKTYRSTTGHQINEVAVAKAQNYSEELVAKKWLKLLEDLKLPDLSSTIPEVKDAGSIDQIMSDYLDTVI